MFVCVRAIVCVYMCETTTETTLSSNTIITLRWRHEPVPPQEPPLPPSHHRGHFVIILFVNDVAEKDSVHSVQPAQQHVGGQAIADDADFVRFQAAGVRLRFQIFEEFRAA